MRTSTNRKLNEWMMLLGSSFLLFFMPIMYSDTILWPFAIIATIASFVTLMAFVIDVVLYIREQRDSRRSVLLKICPFADAVNIYPHLKLKTKIKRLRAHVIYKFKTTDERIHYIGYKIKKYDAKHLPLSGIKIRRKHYKLQYDWMAVETAEKEGPWEIHVLLTREEIQNLKNIPHKLSISADEWQDYRNWM